MNSLGVAALPLCPAVMEVGQIPSDPPQQGRAGFCVLVCEQLCESTSVYPDFHTMANIW